jgi:hypothetical protein
MVNIADDVCLRLQDDVTALNGTFDFPINNDALSCNYSVDVRPAGDHERRAVEFAFNLAIDLD